MSVLGCLLLGGFHGCRGQSEVCDDGRDNDQDGFVDCLDQDCFGVSECANSEPGAGARAPEGQLPGDCSDAVDNDGDALVDCDDDGCLGAPDCASHNEDDDDSANSGDDDDLSPSDDDDAIADDDDDVGPSGDDDASAADDDDVGPSGDDDASAADDDDDSSVGCGGNPAGIEVDTSDYGCADGLDGDCDGLTDCEDIDDCCIYTGPGQDCEGSTFCNAGDDDDATGLPACCETQSCLDMVSDCGVNPADPCNAGNFPWTGSEQAGDGPDHCSNFGAAFCVSCYDGIDGDSDGGADCNDPESLAVQASGDLTTPIPNCFVIRECDGDPATDCP